MILLREHVAFVVLQRYSDDPEIFQLISQHNFITESSFLRNNRNEHDFTTLYQLLNGEILTFYRPDSAYPNGLNLNQWVTISLHDPEAIAKAA